MVSAFHVELPFPVRDTRRRRLSVGEVQTYRDIALTKGHAGRGLLEAKKVFSAGAVEATHLVDVMRQVDVSAAGSLGRHDFSLALDRAGVRLGAEDTEGLYKALHSAGAGRGCDIEMFAQVVKFWAGDARQSGTAPAAIAADEYGVAAANREFPRTRFARDMEGADSCESGGHGDTASPSEESRLRRDGTALEEQARHGSEEINHGSAGVGKASNGEISEERFDTIEPRSNKYHPCASEGVSTRAASQTATMGAVEAAGRKNSFSANIDDIFNHARSGREREGRHAQRRDDLTHTENLPLSAVSGNAVAGNARSRREQDIASDACSPNSRGVTHKGESTRTGEDRAEPPDEAYMHSLGYGNLSSVLPILLDRRTALQVSLESLDRVGTGRVASGDFMAAVRQVGIALSMVQEFNLMDLLDKMGAVTLREGRCQWIDIREGVAAVILAGEKVGGRNIEDKSRVFMEEGQRLFRTLTEQYAKVHVSLLPSSILLGPNAMRERGVAPHDGADGIYVSSGSMRKGLRSAGVLLGDSDEKILWRLLLRKAEDVAGGDEASGGDTSPAPQVKYLLERGLIPLPLLDDVMGFDADEALRARRQVQQQQARPAAPIPAAFRDHIGLGTPGKHSKGQEDDDAPLLLQKARLRVEDLGATVPEREAALVRCLPKLGPGGERQRLPRNELTRVLQQLRVGVRSGELQNLWYHMDKNKVTREGFRRILLDAEDNLAVAFPASPYPYPAGPTAPASDVSYGSNSTSVGGVSVSGARRQRELNRAAYEHNVRRAAGRAIAYGVHDLVEGARGDTAAQFPPRPGSAEARTVPKGIGSLPVLLQKAVRKVREMESGEEAVAALVPNTGRAREGMRVSRGGVQRLLHGIGIIPHSGELQELWWCLERGVVGEPRVSVEDFRQVLLGQKTELELLPEWTVPEDVERHQGGDRPHGDAAGNVTSDNHSPGAQTLREVRTALGLVRRRVKGIIRGCEDRDLSGDGWVSEEDFLAVLKEQGILQQLGNAGLTALQRAVVVEKNLAKGRPAIAAVPYTGLVGGIDDYLEWIMSQDKAEFERALGFGTGTMGGESDEMRNGDRTSLTPKDNGSGGCDGDMLAASPPARPPRERPLRKPVALKDSPNSVARAARGWENDAPVVPLGMRHYPPKYCKMAGLMGGGVNGSSNASLQDERQIPPGCTSSAMMGALRWREDNAAIPPAAASSRSSPERSKPSPSSTTPRMRAALGWDGSNAHSEPNGSTPSSYRRDLGRDEKDRGKYDFIPAGGTPGLIRPHGSTGRRGSVGKSVSLAGGGVSRAICWEEGSDGQQDGLHRQGFVGDATETPSVGEQARDDHHRSPPQEIDKKFRQCNNGQEMSLSARRRRLSNTGEVRELMEAWPDSADPGQVSDGTDDDDRVLLGRSPLNSGSTRGVECEDNKSSMRHVAKALLSDRALLAGLFRQMTGIGGPKTRDGLDRTRLTRLFLHPQLPADLCQQDAEELADAVLLHCGAPAARFSSLTTFLAKKAVAINGASLSLPKGFSPTRGRAMPDEAAASSGRSTSVRDDPVAQSIRRNIFQGRSELQLAAGDAESRLSCAVHLRRAFRKRRKNLGGDPGGIDDCSVGASDLPGVLQDMGVFLNPTQATYLAKKCGAHKGPGRRYAAGGKDEAPVKAGDVLAFFKELLAVN